MLHPKSRFRSLAILFCAIVLSGLPLPVLDAHPTNSAEVSKHPSLLFHLQNAPAFEHQGVEDSEVHVHWVSILLSSDGLSDGNRCEHTHEFLGLPHPVGENHHLCVLVLQWDSPRLSTPSSQPSTSSSIPVTRASELRISRLLI